MVTDMAGKGSICYLQEYIWKYGSEDTVKHFFFEEVVLASIIFLFFERALPCNYGTQYVEQAGFKLIEIICLCS